MVMILFVYRKQLLICLFQMIIKELILKVTIFYEQTIPVTKKEEMFVRIIRNTVLLLKEMNISNDDIFAIIKNLDLNKSHGWDNISITMIKLCVKFIVYPLKLILEASLKFGQFPDYWTKSWRSTSPQKRK